MSNPMSKMEVENLLKSSIQELETYFMNAKSMFLNYSDVATMLNIRSLKRKFEYKAFCFLALSRKLHRMSIEQLCVYVDTSSIEYKKNGTMLRSLMNNDRVSIASEVNVKNHTKQMYEGWLDYEYELAEKLKDMWYKLINSMDDSCIILANFVKCTLDNTNKKIKYIERCMMDYESVSWSTIFIKANDLEIHDHYKKKLETIDKIISK